jgi:hypothetical protein
MTDFCGICKKPIKNGDAIYTIPDKEGNYRHYDCWDKQAGPTARENLKQTLLNMQNKLREMQRTIRKL